MAVRALPAALRRLRRPRGAAGRQRRGGLGVKRAGETRVRLNGGRGWGETGEEGGGGAAFGRRRLGKAAILGGTPFWNDAILERRRLKAPFWSAAILERRHFEVPPFWGAAILERRHLGKAAT